MFTRIHIGAFKSLRDVDFGPAQFNVVIGPNNAGKSALAEFLIYCRRSLSGDAAMQDLGPIAQLDQAITQTAARGTQCVLEVQAPQGPVSTTLLFDGQNLTPEGAITTESRRLLDRTRYLGPFGQP